MGAVGATTQLDIPAPLASPIDDELGEIVTVQHPAPGN